jgi:hypothetical protein
LQVHPVHQTWGSYAITIAIIAVVVALRLRRAGQVRPLKLQSLWVVPVLYFAVAATMFMQLPPTGWVAVASTAALLIGAAFGWQRGKMMRIHVDRETHTLNQQASPVAIDVDAHHLAALPPECSADQQCGR